MVSKELFLEVHTVVAQYNMLVMRWIRRVLSIFGWGRTALVYKAPNGRYYAYAWQRINERTWKPLYRQYRHNYVYHGTPSYTTWHT